MTIHHDKLAYGKLASSMEEMEEEQLLKMLEILNSKEQEEEVDCEKDKLRRAEHANLSKK